MCIIELIMNTAAADKSIGSQSDIIGTIAPPLICEE